jgi:hypothetical protein
MLIALSIPAWLDLGRALRGDPWRSPYMEIRLADRIDLWLRVSVVSAYLRVSAVCDQCGVIS